MIPAGYLRKRVSPPAGWFSEAPVADVCSVSDCVNSNVVDVQNAWLHNGFGVANDPAILGSAQGGDPSATTLFYYEAYEQEIVSDGWALDPAGWRPLSPLRSAVVETNVSPPAPAFETELIGYDVVVFGDYLEHSPLSCNNVAARAAVNPHCLFDTLEAAKAAIDTGTFGGGCEDGAYRIYSVSIVRPAA